MSLFKCVYCEYTSSRNANVERHLSACKNKQTNNKLGSNIALNEIKQNNTNIKIKVVKPEYFCFDCNKEYKYYGGLKSHISKCEKKKERETEQQNKRKLELDEQKIKLKLEYSIKEIKRMKKNYTREKIIMEEQLKAKEKEIEQQKQEKKETVDFYQNLVIQAGTILQSSVSSLTYAMKTYTDAPALKSLEDYSIIHPDLTNKNFAKQLIFYYNKKKLANYLGDFIIKEYKTDIPSEQSLWNSDATRINNIIRKMLHEDNTWAIDKEGVDTREIIIDPMLKYINDIIIETINIYSVQHNMKQTRMNKLLEYCIVLNKIKQEIDTKNLHKAILKYITPSFYMDNTEKVPLKNKPKLLK
jgi:hypothetical protein